MIVRLLFCMCMTLHIIHGKTHDEMKTWLFRQALECNKEYHVTPEEIEIIQKQKLIHTKNAKCLIGCVFKKAKYMDNKGMFDLEGAKAQADINHANDATKIENSKKLMEICKKVNSEPVEDGDEGCERAQLLFKCFIENAPKLGFSVETRK